MKILVISTNSYPHDLKETLLDTKIKTLSHSFDRIYILTSTPAKEAYNVPENVFPIYINTNYFYLRNLYLVYFLLSKSFFTEVKDLLSLGKLLSFSRFKVSFVAWLISKRYESMVMQIFKDHHIVIDQNDIYLHSYWCTEFPISYIRIKRKFPTIHCSSRFHAYDLYEERHNPAYLPFRKMIYRSCDKLVFISQQGKSYFMDKYKIKKADKLFVNYLGVSGLATNEFKLDKFNMENKDLCLVSCSSLIDLKRVDLIIDSLSLVDSVNIHWKHFGDGKNRQYLEVYAKEKLDSKNNITYVFEGHVNNNQINQFYAENKVDLLVNTSLYEGLPISMMEAMSHGIPCVGTNVGGVSEIIQDNFNGFLLPVTFEPGALANILINFAKLSKNEKQGFVQNAYNTWDEKFNGVKNISELELNLFKDSLDFTMIW